MRVWILVALLPCALLAQTSPPRPANQGAFEKLPLVSPVAIRPGDSVTVAASSGVCSIPLLRVPMAKGSIDRMSVPTPPGEAIDPKFILPPPAVCEAWKP